MLLRHILVIVAAQAVLIEFTYSQCIGRSPAYDLNYNSPYSSFAYNGYLNSPFTFSSFGLASAFSTPYGPMSLFGNFPFSKITCTGNPKMSVMSDNIVEGLVSVAGRLPFLGTVAVEGVFPTYGNGVVNYNCGGLVGIMSEVPGPVLENIPIVTPAIAPALAPALPSAVAPSFGYGVPVANGYGYGPLGYEPYAADLAYGNNYGFSPYNYGPSLINYDPTYIDGYFPNGYGYGAVY